MHCCRALIFASARLSCNGLGQSVPVVICPNPFQGPKRLATPLLMRVASSQKFHFLSSFSDIRQAKTKTCNAGLINASISKLPQNDTTTSHSSKMNTNKHCVKSLNDN